jgi:hypothetical protein
MTGETLDERTPDGVRQSYSTWLSQFAAFTSGLPAPTVAYASRAASAVLQKRICCCIDLTV